MSVIKMVGPRLWSSSVDWGSSFVLLLSIQISECHGKQYARIHPCVRYKRVLLFYWGLTVHNVLKCAHNVLCTFVSSLNWLSYGLLSLCTSWSIYLFNLFMTLPGEVHLVTLFVVSSHLSSSNLAVSMICRWPSTVKSIVSPRLSMISSITWNKESQKN